MQHIDKTIFAYAEMIGPASFQSSVANLKVNFELFKSKQLTLAAVA